MRKFTELHPDLQTAIQGQPRIGTALSFLVGALMVFTVSVMLYYGMWVDWQMDKRLSFTQAERVARVGEELQTSLIQSSKILLDSLAVTPIARYGSSMQLRALFKSVLPQHDRRYVWWMMLRADGTPFVTEGDGLSELLDEGWLHTTEVVVEARLLRRFSVGNFIQNGNRNLLPMAVPVMDGHGKILRYLLVAWDSSVGQSHLASLLDKNDRVLFINPAGEKVLQYPPDNAEAQAKTLSLEVRAALSGPMGVREFEAPHTPGGPRYVCTRPILDDNGRLLVHVVGSVPQPTFLEFVERRYLNQLISFTILFILTLPLTWLFCKRYIIRGLQHLTDVARRTTQGDLSVRNQRVTGCLEIQTVARAYDSMLDRLESHTRELADREQRLTLALEAAHQGVWTWRPGVPCLDCDMRMSLLLGFSGPVCVRPEELMELIHPDDRDSQMLEGDFFLPTDGKEFRREIRVRAHDSWTWLLLIGRIHKETNNLFGTAMDITRSKEADEIIRADAERYRLLSNTDALTGLWNRRYFSQVVSSEMRRARRYRRPFSVALCDLDFFKRINDTYGHDAGDAVLVNFSRLMQANLRESDIVARVGGEEFAFFLPETDLSSALRVFDKLRSTVENSAITYEEHTIHVTMSAGLATSTLQDDDTPAYHQLMRKADEALYQAKRDGRNCIRY